MKGTIKVTDKVEPDIVVTAGQDVLETLYGSQLAEPMYYDLGVQKVKLPIQTNLR